MTPQIICRARACSAVLAIFLLVSLPGCITSKQGQGTVKHFPLTIALTGPIGDTGSPLPEDVKALVMPFQVKNCSGTLFIPDVKIIRVDLEGEGARPVDLDMGQEQNAIQRAAGQAVNPDKARSVREEAVEKQQITSFMSQPGGPDAATNENIKRLLASPNNQNIFSFAGTQRAVSLLNTERVAVASNTNDLLAKIGLTFCSRPGEKPPNQLPTSIVIYKPGTALDETAGAAPSKSPGIGDGGESPASATQQAMPVAQASRDQADASYNQLSAEVQTSFTDQTKKKAVHAQLAKAQAEYTWDYRFSYERAKLAVYGKESHDEAFHHLYRAAEIAIENGDSGNMLKALQADGEEEGLLHKLAHGHQEWKMLLLGLETNNSELVRR